MGLPGENFVSMHRGLADLDDKGELEDLLLFPTCESFELDDSNDNDQFGQYFSRIGGYDNDHLFGNYDKAFLKIIADADDLDGTDDRYMEQALGSTDFDDFCENLIYVNREVKDAFKVLESHIFDWRQYIARVEIPCSGGDGG